MAILSDDPALDLASHFQESLAAARQSLSADDALDAFLHLATASQLMSDFCEADKWQWGRIARFLASLEPGALYQQPAGLAVRAERYTSTLRGRRWPGIGRAMIQVNSLLDSLARSVILEATGQPSPPAAAMDPMGRLGTILHECSKWPSELLDQPARLPSCFRSFDQHPRDMDRLAIQILAQWLPDLRPWVVVGVRTSGTYLAPLLVAALAVRGRLRTSWCTLRPGFSATLARSQLHELRHGGGVVIVVDDPPTTGRALAAAVKELRQLGIDVTDVRLAVALRTNRLPEPLADIPAAVVTWAEWDIHRRLRPENLAGLVHEALGEQYDAAPAPDGTRLLQPDPGGHVRMQLDCVPRPGGAGPVHHLVAEGSGLGFLGRHPDAVARRLEGLVPPVLAQDDGVVIRRWFPAQSAVNGHCNSAWVEAVAHYVARRQDLLPAPQDRSVHMGDQLPVWEAAGGLLSAVFGRAEWPVRHWLLGPALRTMLTPKKPSLVDGQTGPGSWFTDPDAPGDIIKVCYADRDFSHLDLACYDAAYDLAGAAVGADLKTATALLSRFAAMTGEHVDPERWLTYRLVHGWDRRRIGALGPFAEQRAAAQAWQQWFQPRLRIPAVSGQGPICLLDIDGVLESDRLGASVLTPASARALSALHRHGCRPLIASGRSIAEVRDRCLAYGLPGGVAEYGGCWYRSDEDRAVERITFEQRVQLVELGHMLRAQPGVHLDDTYATGLRACKTDRNGRRTALDGDLITQVLAIAAGELVVASGATQTDFIFVHVDKAAGLADLLAALDIDEAAVGFAVGDSHTDLGMLSMAPFRGVPGHARALASESTIISRHPYQAGLEDLVARFLGHPSSACPACAPPPAPPLRVKLIEEVLAACQGDRHPLRTALALSPIALRLCISGRSAGRSGIR